MMSASIDDAVKRVEDHLKKIIGQPETKLDTNLLGKVNDGFDFILSKEQSRRILESITGFLEVAQQDPEPATRLAEKLVSRFTFDEVQCFKPPVSLVAGLTSQSPPIQRLCLRVVGLASRGASDVAVVAANIPLVRSLVEVWLSTGDTAVAEKAGDVLRSLLQADTAPESLPGLMQRRLFKDRDVYELFYSIPSLTNDNQRKNTKTIAQGRLFDFLERIWHFDDVWHSQIRDVEVKYGLRPDQGLIQFASLYMIDLDDIILRRTRIEFFGGLLRSISPALWASRVRDSRIKLPERRTAASKMIKFFEDAKIHEDIVSLYAEPQLRDPVDAQLLHAAAALYVAEYLLNFRAHFVSDKATQKLIYARLLKSLGETQASQWARNDGPSDDLDVLVSLPFPILATDPSPFLLLPTRPPCPDCFFCLATIFSGIGAAQRANDLKFPITADTMSDADKSEAEFEAESDAWASRYLFIQYMAAHPGFWSNVIAASNAVALKDAALSANNLMTAIVRAKWQLTPPFGLSVPDNVKRLSPGSDAPDTGLAAVLHPSVLDLIVPYLLKSPGDGRGVGLLGADTEGTEFHVARAKLELTDALKEGIQGMLGGLPDSHSKAVLGELAVQLGAFSRQSRGRGQIEPGAEVGTMEL